MFNLKKKKENLLPGMQGENEMQQNTDGIGKLQQENDEETPDISPEKLDETEDFSQTEAGDMPLCEDSGMMSAFEAWLEDSMPETERREAAKSAMCHVRDAIGAGDYDEAIFDVVSKGADYDRAVAEASALAEAQGREEGVEEGRRAGFEEGLEKGLKEGEIKGRNAGIEEYFEKCKDDGVPHPGFGGANRRVQALSIFDLARSAF